eukprot:tig00000076_g2331.t1
MQALELLNYKNVQFILIGADVDVVEELGEPGQQLGSLAEAEEELDDPDRLFKELRLKRGSLPVEPLVTGHWE